MQGNEYTLPNGLRIIHEPTLSKVAYCGFAIDAGTRDEAENEQGMAHFVEQYEDIFWGPFSDKKHWITVYLEGDVPDKLIKELISHSVEEVIKKLPKKKQEEYRNMI